MRYALALLAAILVWSLMPDADLGPYDALNPRRMTEFVLLTLVISGAARLLANQLGHQAGLALTGFMGGFASSTATIYAMAAIGHEKHVAHNTAVLGALLSNFATPIQMLVLVSLLVPSLLGLVFLPALSALLILLGLCAWRFAHSRPSRAARPEAQHPGPVVDWRSLATLSALTTATTLAAAAVFHELGPRSMPLIGAISGLVDAHAVIPSMGALVAQGRLAGAEAALPILVSFSVNSGIKCLVAWQAGGHRFARPVLVSLLLANSALWLTFLGT